MKHTGFHSAQHVTPGTIIENVYFAVPEGYLAGDEYVTYLDALTAAIEKKQTQIARFPNLLIPETIWMDTRWVLRDPAKTSQISTTDTVAERTTYETLADAQAHAERITKFARVGA